MERGGWWTTVQGVAKSQTQPSQSTAAAAAFMIVKKWKHLDVHQWMKVNKQVHHNKKY